MSEEISVTAHYGTGDLRARVEEALSRAGLGSGTVAWSELALLDQFHVRGLAATKELGESLKVRKEHAVLDVGCGLGGPSRYLAATFGCRVEGIDLSQAYVDVARMLAERSGLAAQVSYRQADALELPFAEAEFDIVWTQHAAMNIADRARLYGEMHRVLKPGGRLAIYDVLAGEGGPLIFPVPWAREPAISFLLTSQAMRSLLEEGGFKVLSWRDKTHEGIAWFSQQQAARQAGRATPPLGIQVVMGPEFPAMIENLGRNLREGRARLLEAVLQKR